jgi:hypothetical protein
MIKEIEKLKENRQRKQLEKIKLEEEKNRLNKGMAGVNLIVCLERQQENY